MLEYTKKRATFCSVFASAPHLDSVNRLDSATRVDAAEICKEHENKNSGCSVAENPCNKSVANNQNKQNKHVNGNKQTN